MNIEDLRASGLLPPGSRVLCAVSGGADSMCLLHLLYTGRESLGIQVCAAHFEHGLRGEESLRDAAFVEDWCQSRQIPFVLEHGDVPRCREETGLGTEEAARELRYAFLERAAEELNCDKIATAHNADDNAETILLHLCRGSGAAGLRGIPPVRGKIVRPLLAFSRAEIEAYLAENGVPHVEDSSNESETFSRNRLRLQVMPVLRQLNPRFADAAARTTALLREDEDCLRGEAEAFVETYFDGGSLPLDAFRKLHRAVASRVLRRLCPRSLEQDHVEAALDFSLGSERAYLDLPGLRLRREQGRLWFSSEEERTELPWRAWRPGETLEIPELGLRVTAEFAQFHEEIHDLFKTCSIKCANIDGPLAFTGRQPGDRLRPAGRNCTKSLKALFAERHMTRRERDETLILRDGKGPLLVRGLALDERALPAAGDPVWRLHFESMEHPKK